MALADSPKSMSDLRDNRGKCLSSPTLRGNGNADSISGSLARAFVDSDARAVLVCEMLEAGELTAMFDEKGVAYDKTQLLA
jgi:hypothetical protein